MASRIADFHGNLKPRAAEAFLTLRALAVSLGPDVTEQVSGTTVTYARRGKPFLVVQQVKTRLHVAFPSGVPVLDPNGRLLRRGEERYVTIEGSEGVDGHVQEFVRKAYAGLRS